MQLSMPGRCRAGACVSVLARCWATRCLLYMCVVCQDCCGMELKTCKPAPNLVRQYASSRLVSAVTRATGSFLLFQGDFASIWTSLRRLVTVRSREMMPRRLLIIAACSDALSLTSLLKRSRNRARGRRVLEDFSTPWQLDIRKGKTGVLYACLLYTSPSPRD